MSAASTVWKTILQAVDLQEIEVPAGSEMLCAREQSCHLCLWYRCDPDAPKEKRKIAIVGTGNPAPDKLGKYLGTAMLFNDSLVLHVFEYAP